MNLFESIKSAPPDPILGISEAFRNDPNPRKINLSVGVYQDESGKSPLLNSVRKAEELLLQNEESKGYLPIPGDPDFIRATQNLVFGPENEMVVTGRVASLHTPGGTAALRLAGEFVRSVLNRRNIWVSRPTWANHEGVFSRAGLDLQYYPYFNQETHELNLDGMLTVLEDIPENDVVLFHGCCHNPTGVDPTPDDWETIAKICKERQLLPIVDFAYQGFAHGLIDDAEAIRAFSKYGLEYIICSSFSKNFSLYRERVGAFHLIAKNKEEAERSMSQLKVLVRTNYSNPPAHGGAIIKTILENQELRLEWDDELASMRNRIRTMRQLLVDKLKEHEVPGDFEFINQQNGMFSFSGLSPEIVQKLRDQYSIYIVKSGRINVAGLSEKNVDIFCSAVKKCMGNSQ